MIELSLRSLVREVNHDVLDRAWDDLVPLIGLDLSLKVHREVALGSEVGLPYDGWQLCDE